MQQLSKNDLYAIMVLRNYMLPNLGNSITKADLLYIVQHPSSCLTKNMWKDCTFSVRCGKDYLRAQIHRYHLTAFDERCWINSTKNLKKKYLLSYLYSLHASDTIFIDHTITHRRRNLKKQRKHPIRERRNIVPFIGNYHQEALNLFNTHGEYFEIPIGINGSFWNEFGLNDDKSRFATIQLLNQMHRLIKLLD